jgi:glycerate 2-kinase
MPDPSVHDAARAIYDAAVRGVDPAGAVHSALRASWRVTPPASAPVWLVALGKAAGPMTRAALAALDEIGVAPAGGIVVTHAPVALDDSRITVAVGDHPIPGEGSFAAAALVGELASRVGADDIALVLLSGGASSLIAAPIDGVSVADLVRLYGNLLASGADILAVNAVRKRFSRWGGGRLATAIAGRVTCLIVSDVLGDDPAYIGSGPCAPDPLRAAELLELIDRRGLEPDVPPALRALLADVAAGRAPETPKPDDPAFGRVHGEIVLANRHALRAAAAAARALGITRVTVVDEPLDDDAALTGVRIADELIRFREGGLRGDATPPPSGEGALACMLWGGETTVRLGAGPVSPGGRCQELALSVARALHDAGDRGRGIVVLAGGTDGRDGATDAAGATVDAATWSAIVEAGRDPERDLIDHLSHSSLDAAGALLRTGPTGTNVQDVVIGLVEIPRSD